MDMNTIAVLAAIAAIVGTGIALWRVLDVSLREIRRDVGDCVF